MSASSHILDYALNGGCSYCMAHKEKLGLVARTRTVKKVSTRVVMLQAMPAPRGAVMADTKIILTVPPGTAPGLMPAVVCGPRVLDDEEATEGQPAKTRKRVRDHASCDDIWGMVLSQVSLHCTRLQC